MDSFHFEYDKNKILVHASLDITTGEKVVVTGANGSGKSTLISILLGIFKGQGYLLQPAYQKISAQLTPQSLLPVPLSEQLNSVARENGNEELLQELITELELESLVDRLPDTLSAGQQQKFTILLCLLKKADLYLFDEPLANIAMSQRHKIFAMILQRLHGKTTVCVMHEGKEILAHFDRIITLDQGQFYSRRPEEKLYAKS